MKDLLDAIAKDVKDIFAYGIDTTKAYSVPSRNDVGLTFPIGADKKGKTIETCVLFIDIRNSTDISRRLNGDKIRLGKIYESFIYSMAWIADEYGYVRNIIGDRIMVVFEPKSCFIDAINCAALMYTVAIKILKPHVGLAEAFKVGIGIEYGELLILKAGITKHEKEQSEYKGLVWVGNAANIASKLTDFANKQYYAPLFHVRYNELVYQKKYKGISKPKIISFDPILFEPGQPIYEEGWVKMERTVTLPKDTFVHEVEIGATGSRYQKHEITSINKENQSGTSSPILMSGKVYKEFTAAVPDSPLVKLLAEKKYPNMPYTATGVFGGVIILPEGSQFKGRMI